MLNHALRTMEMDAIIELGFFLRDFHTHIAQLHFEECTGQLPSDSFIVYRNQCMRQTDFGQLIKTGGDYYHSILFYRLVRFVKILIALVRKLESSDEVRILFGITVDPSVRSSPFANICIVSCYQTEEEIVCTMYFVFRVGQIKQIKDKQGKEAEGLAYFKKHLKSIKKNSSFKSSYQY